MAVSGGALVPAQVSPLRRFGTSLLLASAGVYLATLSAARGVPLSSTLVVFAALGGAALATVNRRLLPQVFARAIAWLAFAPSALAVGFLLASGRSTAEPLPFALAAGMALLAGAPLVHTEEAHDPFAPVRYRRTWIAAATASIAASILTGAAAVLQTWFGGVASGIGLAVLAVGLATSARAVLSMRGYGVVLGAATSLVALVAGVATGLTPLLLAAIPGAMMVAPLVLSRLVPARDDPAPSARVRVARDGGAETRLRVPDEVSRVDDFDAIDAPDEAPAPQKARRLD